MVRIRRLGQIILIADQAWVSAGNFFTTLLCARAMDGESFGLFSIALVAVLFAGTINSATLLFPLATTFHRLPPNKRIPHLYGALEGFSAIGCSLLIVASLLPLTYVKGAVSLSSMTFLVVTLQFQETIRRGLLIQERYHQLLVCDLLTFGPRLAALAFIPPGTDLRIVTVILGLSAIGGAVGFLPDRPREKGAWMAEAWKKHRTQAYWLLPSGLLQWSSVNLFLLVGSVLLLPSQMGNVRLAQNLAAFLNPVVHLTENVIPMHSSKIMTSSGREAMWHSLQKNMWISAPAFLILAACASLFADSAMRALYNRTFAGASWVVFFLFVVQWMGFNHVLVRAGLRCLDKPKLWLVAYIVGTAVAVAIAFTSPFLSERGLSIGMALTSITVFLIGYHFLAQAIRS